MTLQELKERVDIALQNGRNANIQVRIPNHKSGLAGGTPCTDVAFAYQGIDWDHSTFFIIPEKEMIEKPIKIPPSEEKKEEAKANFECHHPDKYTYIDKEHQLRCSLCHGYI